MARESDSSRPRWVSAAPMAPASGAGFGSFMPFRLAAPPITGDSSVQLEGLQIDSAQGTVGPLGGLPAVPMGALLDLGDETSEGVLVLSVGAVWWRLLPILAKDPAALQLLGWREWEEMLAGIVDQMDFDEVRLTPRKGDRGRDVIAVRKGFGSIRLLGQMKAYGPGHPVTADEIRSLLGVLWDPNASKALLATTSTFAPDVMKDPTIANASPYRLELLDGDQLRKWMAFIAACGGK